MAGTAPDGRPAHSALDFHPENRSYLFPALGSLLNAWETAFPSRRFQAPHACDRRYAYSALMPDGFERYAPGAKLRTR